MTPSVLLLVVCAVLLWPRAGHGIRGPGSGSSDREAGPSAPWHTAIGTAWRARPGAVSGGGWVADFADVVATALDAGLSLEAACDVAASTPSVAGAAPGLLRRLAEARAQGRGVAHALHPRDGPRPAPGDGGPGGDAEADDLLVLLAAWRLSESLGTPAASVTATTARSLRERQAARERLEATTAGPRTSMVLLSALPLLGPVGATVAGVGPGRLYAGAAGVGSLVIGLALTGVGWWWARSLLGAAARPGRTGARAPGPRGEGGEGRVDARWSR